MAHPSATSTANRYGTRAITLHWLSAALVIVMIVLGAQLDDIEDPRTHLLVLRTHAAIGVTVLILTGLRLLWRLADRKPDPPPGMAQWQTVAARAAHRLLYLLLLVIPASGITAVLTTGALSVLLGMSGSALPEGLSDSLLREVHGTLAWFFVLLLLLHIAAALYHHWIRRDDVLRRMWWPTRPTPGQGPEV